MKTYPNMENLLVALSENIIIKSIRHGLLFIMPLVMVGSFVLMMLNLPLEFVNNFLNNIFGDHWRLIGLSVHRGTFLIMSLSIILSVSYSFAKEYSKRIKENLSPIFVVLVSLSCFVIAYPGVDNSVIDETAIGTTGIFGAIFIGITSAYIFIFLYRHIHRKHKEYVYNADTILISAINSILPAFITIFLFALLRYNYDYMNLSEFFSKTTNQFNLLLGKFGGIISGLLYVAISHILWFFGIHGTNMLEPLAQNIFVNSSEINILLAESGQIPTEILTKEFFDIFVFSGGAGCTLGLIIMLFIVVNSSNTKKIAKLSILPALFNINELIVYGLPIIFNPYYIVPFIITPIVLSLTSYAAFALGLVPLTTARVVWTTPIFISGYISTGSIAGVILQVFNLALSMAIYYPFIRLYEKQISNNSINIFNKFTEEYNTEKDTPVIMLTRNDEFGIIARSLATELYSSLEGTFSGLHLEYQPKTNCNGNVIGAEALLRWNHPVYGYISPLVILGLAEESGFAIKLENWVLETAFSELNKWKEQGYNLVLSVNITPNQLRKESQLYDKVKDLIDHHSLDTNYMELELTEHSAFNTNIFSRSQLEKIREMGINLSIDDFGMGSSTMLYLRDFCANVVKLDISLVRSINENVKSQEIVRSIMSLCKQLNATVIAEGVETKEQLEILQELGCELFQGWYFSKALPPSEFIKYLDEHGIVENNKTE